MTAEQHQQTIREFTRIFKNEHSLDGVGHLFHADFRHNFRAPLPTGFEGLRQVGIMMNGAFPDVVVTEEDLIASSDTVVERSSAVATHKGSMMGESPTNQRIHWSEIHIYRMRDRKIAEHWAEISMMELLLQIGVLTQLGSYDICHTLQIAAKPDAVYPLVSTAQGLAQWWAQDVWEPDGAVELGFFKRTTTYRLRLKDSTPPSQAQWHCETGQEWSGTRIAFHLEAGGPGTILRFAHAGWRVPTDYLTSCNTTWGELMFRLKAAAEGKRPGPLFLTDRLAV